MKKSTRDWKLETITHPCVKRIFHTKDIRTLSQPCSLGMTKRVALPWKTGTIGRMHSHERHGDARKTGPGDMR